MNKLFIPLLSLIALSACSNSASYGGSNSSGTTTLNLTISPISVAANTEQTNCVTLKLSNSAAAVIRKINLQVDPGTAQIIVYKSSATTEVPSPGVSCTTFGGIQGTEHPLFMSNEASSILSFPADSSGYPIGPVISANQMLKFEVHLFNSTASAANIGATFSVDILASDAYTIASDIALSGSTNLNTAPNSTSQFNTFSASLPNIHLFAINTQQWHFGTDNKIYRATNSSDTSEQIFDATDWSNPTIHSFTPALDMTGKGLLMTCSYNNTSSNPVGFGPSALTDETCFVWQYYYPAAGFQRCTNGTCTTIP
ncbi:MAG: monooxygenase [Pseudobdellovibrio sp.]